MSRFSGWTMKDVERLSGVVKETAPNLIKTKSKLKLEQPDYVGMISGALDILGVDHVREYKFLEDRRFKFDLAIPEKKIAIEFEGGIFSGGRHTRWKGYANDAKKYNLATMHGWKLLRYTSADVNQLNWEFKVADEIKQMTESKQKF